MSLCALLITVGASIWAFALIDMSVFISDNLKAVH